MPYQMEGSLDIAQRIIAQVDADLQAILAPEVFARYYPDVPAPTVSLEMLGTQPEPLHVFTWSTARDFGIEQNLSVSGVPRSRWFIRNAYISHVMSEGRRLPGEASRKLR